MTEKIYKYEVHSRSNTIESVFVARQEEIDWIVGKEIWFGDIWGKHSSVSLKMETSDFTVVSEDPAAVEVFKTTIGLTGICPFDFLEMDPDLLDEYDSLMTRLKEEDNV